MSHGGSNVVGTAIHGGPDGTISNLGRRDDGMV